MMWTSHIKWLYQKMKLEVETYVSNGIDVNIAIEGVMHKYNALNKDYTTDIYLLLNKESRFYNIDRQRQKLKKEGFLEEVGVEGDIGSSLISISDVSNELEYDMVCDKIDAKVLLKKFKAIKKKIQKEKSKNIKVLIKDYLKSDDYVSRGIAKKSLMRVIDRYLIKDLINLLLHNEYIRLYGLLNLI